MATFNATGLMNIGFLVIGAVVGTIILAALAPEYFTALADLVGVFTDPTTTTNSTAADALLDPLGLIIAFAGLAAIVVLAIMVTRPSNRS